MPIFLPALDLGGRNWHNNILRYPITVMKRNDPYAVHQHP